MGRKLVRLFNTSFSFIVSFIFTYKVGFFLVRKTNLFDFIIGLFSKNDFKLAVGITKWLEGLKEVLIGSPFINGELGGLLKPQTYLTSNGDYNIVYIFMVISIFTVSYNFVHIRLLHRINKLTLTREFTFIDKVKERFDKKKVKSDRIDKILKDLENEVVCQLDVKSKSGIENTYCLIKEENTYLVQRYDKYVDDLVGVFKTENQNEVKKFLNDLM